MLVVGVDVDVVAVLELVVVLVRVVDDDVVEPVVDVDDVVELVVDVDENDAHCRSVSGVVVVALSPCAVVLVAPRGRDVDVLDVFVGERRVLAGRVCDATHLRSV